jgi:hypothetical protein
MPSLAARRLLERLVSRYEDADIEFLRLRLEFLQAGAHAQHGVSTALFEESLKYWYWTRFEPCHSQFKTPEAALRDFELALGLEQRDHERPLLRWLTEHGLQLLAAAAVVASSVFGIAYYRFYAKFGVGLEELSLGSPQLFSQSLISGIAFVLVAGLMLAVCFAPCALLAAAEARDQPVTPTSVGVFCASVVVAGVAAWVSTRWPHYDLFVETPPWLAIATVVTVPLVWVGHRAVKGKQLVGRMDRLLATALGLTAVFVALLILIESLPQAVDQEVAQARRGESVQPLEIVGFPLLDIRAQRVRVEPISQEASGWLPHGCLLYLGQGSEQTVLYEVGRSVHRLPTSSVAVSTVTAGRDC